MTRNNIRHILLILTLSCQYAAAQQKSLVPLGINERISGENIDDAKIEILYKDTIRVGCKTMKQRNATYSIELDYKPGKYTILADKEGFETGCITSNSEQPEAVSSAQVRCSWIVMQVALKTK